MDKFFKLSQRGTTVSREIMGGLTTFLAMAYILAVNPNILSGAGIPNLSAGLLPSWNGVFTATALSAAIATLVMGFMANLPIALAPGLGLNAFFTYSVVLGMGASWQLALTAVLFEGVFFIILSLCGVREAIMNSIPDTLKKAVAVGLGLFIAVIGLADAGIVSGDTGTLIGFVNFDLKHYSAIIAAIGLIVTIVLYIMKVPGAVLIGVIVTTIIGIPFGVTKIPENFSPISFPSAPHLFAFDFKGIAFDSMGNFSGLVIGKFFVIFFTFLFMDFFDTLGTLLGVANQANLFDEKGNVLNAKEALLADSVGTVAGACLGTSTVTSFAESASGIAAGARTGLASVVTALLFLLALFISPLFFLIPAAATAPALIFVGYLMMKSVTKIDFEDPTEGIPAFISIAVMPFAYSISKGIAWGVISFCICKLASKRFREVPLITWILGAIFLGNIIFEALK